MIKIAICEDDPDMLNIIENYIKNEMTMQNVDYVLNTYSNGNKLIEDNQKQKFDILFLDICMPDISGFDVAQHFRFDNNSVYIIFITSNSEYVYSSFNYQPFNFIRKNPADLLKQGLSDVIKSLLRHLKQNEKIVIDPALGADGIMPLYKINFIKSDRHYLEYNLIDNTTIRSRESINEREKFLHNYDFIRIHKRYLVNMKHIHRIDKYSDIVITKNNIEIDLGRIYKEQTLNSYKNYLRTLS